MTGTPPAAVPGPRTALVRRDARVEGLRGYLALGVTAYHTAFYAGISAFYGTPTHGIWTVLVEGLVASLPPFFILSGFFLYRGFARTTLSGEPRPAPGAFLVRRFFRLAPGYWTALLAAVLLINLSTMDGAWHFVKEVLFLQFYVPNTPWLSGFEQSWTVPAELTYYALLPGYAALAAWFARRGRTLESRARRLALPLLLFAAVGIVWTFWVNVPSHLETAATWNMWYWPFGYFDGFAVGMAFAVLSAYARVCGRTPAVYRFTARHPNLFWLGALAVWLVNLPRFFGTLGGGDWAALRQEVSIHVLVLLFGTLLVFPLTVPDVRSRLMDAVLGNAVMRYLGRLSYGIYLWHVIPTLLYLEQGNLFGGVLLAPPELRGTKGFWELMLVTVPAAVAMAAVSYHGVERPMHRFGSALADRMQARRKAPAGVAERPTADQIPEMS